MKKGLVLVLALVLCAAMLSEAMAVTLSPAMEKLAESREELVDGDETLDITWLGWNLSGVLPLEESVMKEVMQKRFNVRIKDVPVDVYNKEQLNTTYATDVQFDVNTNSVVFSTLADLGLLRTVDKTLLETYAPTMIAALEAEVGDNWPAFATYDGELYGIPQITASWTAPIVLGVRKDWYEKVGGDVENPPRTLEELEALLLKFHTEDPDGNGKDDTYALNMHTDVATYIFGAYGMSKRYWYNDAEGNPMTWACDPNLKEVLKVMARWYDLGIFDPEVVIDTRTETSAKVEAGTVGGFFANDGFFVRTGGISPVPGGDMNVEWMMLPPVSVNGGQPAASQYNVALSAKGVAFGRNASDEKVIRILQMLDAGFRDRELWMANNFGEEGVTYALTEDGFVTNTEETLAYTKEHTWQSEYAQQRYTNFNFMPKEFMKYRYTDVRWGVYEQIRDYPVVAPCPVGTLKTEAELEYQTAVNTVADEFFWQTVTGEVDVDAEWESYLARWNDAGGREIMEAKKALYQQNQ